MLCKNCGCNNPDFATTCANCRSPLNQGAAPANALGGNQFSKFFASPLYIITVICMGVYALALLVGWFSLLEDIDGFFELLGDDLFSGMRYFDLVFLPIFVTLAFIGMLISCVNRGRGSHAVTAAGFIGIGAVYALVFLGSFMVLMDKRYSDAEDVLILAAAYLPVILASIFGGIAAIKLQHSVEHGVKDCGIAVPAAIFCFVIPFLVIVTEDQLPLVAMRYGADYDGNIFGKIVTMLPVVLPFLCGAVLLNFHSLEDGAAAPYAPAYYAPQQPTYAPQPTYQQPVAPQQTTYQQPAAPQQPTYQQPAAPTYDPNQQ